MIFPIKVKDRGRWEAILRAGRERGIDIHTWPSMPREVIARDLFGSAERWRRFLFLPIHQDLKAEDYGRRLAGVFDSI